MTIFYIFDKSILAKMELANYYIGSGTLVLLLICDLLYRYLAEAITPNALKKWKKIYNLNGMKMPWKASEKIRLSSVSRNRLDQVIVLCTGDCNYKWKRDTKYYYPLYWLL